MVRYMRELHQMENFLDIINVHVWDFKFVRSLLGKLDKKHLRSILVTYLIEKVSDWQYKSHIDINADVYHVMRMFFVQIEKNTVRSISKALDILEEFSITSRRLKLRWAIFCEARKEAERAIEALNRGRVY